MSFNLLSVSEVVDPNAPVFTDDKIVFGILMGVLGLIFYTNSKKGWKKFYKYIPALFLCYFIPALLTTAGLIHPEYTDLYSMAKYYCLPAALILMTLSIDIPGNNKARTQGPDDVWYSNRWDSYWRTNCYSNCIKRFLQKLWVAKD